MKKLFTLLFSMAILKVFAVTITNLTPTSGPIGTSVTISGSGFSATAANNTVWFGGVKATVKSASTTSLIVIVPIGAGKPIRVFVDTLMRESTKSFIVTFTGGGSITTSTFSTKVDFATGSQPRSVSMGDLDGDGKMDLAVANLNSSTVSLFRNTSAFGSMIISSFNSKVDLSTESGPISVSIGDIDGDGKMDLTVGYNGSTNISVFRNTSTAGSISFASKVDFATGFGPYSLSIGDIDDDGKMDLAVANRSSGTVSVLRNTSINGSISFTSKVDFFPGFSPISVSMGDIDGDGKMDLTVANETSNNVSILRNTSITGSINFASKIDFATGSAPYSVSIGDIDGDGKMDLAVANNGSANVSVLRNTSITGSISFASKVDFATGFGPYSLSIGDIDGDEKMDLAVANWSSNTISVFKNTSTAGSITSSSFANKLDFVTGNEPRSVSIGDLDGDGKMDLAVANRGSNTVSVLRNTIYTRIHPSITNLSPTTGPIGTTVSITGTNFSSTATNNTVWFGGVKASILSASATNLIVTVPIGAGNPIRVYRDSVVFFIGQLMHESPKIFIVTSTGELGIKSSSFASKLDFATGTGPYSISIGDLDGDGKLDLAVANRNSNTVSVYRNAYTIGGVDSNSFTNKLDFTTGGNPFSVSIGDIDGDGKIDLVVANNSSNTVSVLRNTSTSGSISFENKVDFTTGSGPRSISMGDIDGDGKMDLTVANENSSKVSVLRNTSSYGSISFANKLDFTTGIAPQISSIGDIDGDGKMDLTVSNRVSNTVSVLRNTSISGSISFASKVDFATGTYPYSVAIGDIDGDGKMDLAVPNAGSATNPLLANVSIYRNTSIAGSISFANNVDFSTESDPYSVSIGDIDGDGKIDLAVTNFYAKSVSVFKNTSIIGSIDSNSFESKVDFTTGTEPYSASIGDINGDGKMDLEVANYNSNTVSILRNVGQYLTPSITSFTPTSGEMGVIVTITGKNLTGATSVKFGGTNATSFTVLSDSSITAVVGIGTTGVITVTTPGGTASSLGIFTFNAAPILSPNLIYPLNSATSLPLNFMFRWDGVSTATNYNFKLSDVSTFSSLIKDTITNDSSYNMNGLNANTNYYWKVNAINNAGIGPFSPVWSFLTKSGTSINNIITDGYSIYQNHPNPFSSSTTIKFELQNELNVKIEIYNSFGQLVQILLDNKMPAKIHEVIWDAEKFSTGLYFYKIVLTDIYNPNQEFVQTSKMMLVK